MKISDRIPTFFKTTPYFTNPSQLWKNLNPFPTFRENFENSPLTPPPIPVYKGGILTMNIQVLFLYKLSWLVALSTLSHEFVSKWFLIPFLIAIWLPRHQLGPLSSRQPHSPDVNTAFYIFRPKITRSLVTRLGP